MKKTRAEKPLPKNRPTKRVGSGRLVRRLWLKLHHRGADYYWHCHKRKKLPPIDLPKAEFDHALWPDKGLTFGTACDINGVVERIRGAGEYEVECGHYIITAYWRTASPNNPVSNAAGTTPRQPLA